MEYSEFDSIIKQALEESGRLLSSKAEEYAPGLDRLSEFKHAAALHKCHPMEHLFHLMSKHYITLSEFANHPQDLSMGSWCERLVDIRNYTILAEALLVEAEKESSS